MNLLIMGAPGSGKGTQAKSLSEKLGIPTISTGAMLRAAIAQKTQLGNKAKGYIDLGNLVPDDIIIGIVMERLKQQDCSKGYILDGFPRTLKQAVVMNDAGINIDNVILVDVSDEVIINRIVGRRVCIKCGATYHIINIPPKVAGVCDVCKGKLVMRKDDTAQTMKHRLQTYHEQTEPVIDYYKKKGKLIVVNGADSLKNTTTGLLTALECEI